jgi:predicted pyridoxine 5'-phosphate oxidase superfamily flavin-nucleotide-binding protein
VVPHRYLAELVTPAVAVEQHHYGSRDAVARVVAGWDTASRLGPDEAEFIAERDTFFLASVGETGWPYVQHRGGPAGFLRVLDDGATLAWADFRGNRQLLSVGNVSVSQRVSLLLLDQAHARRLKVIGTATVHDVRGGDSSGLLDRVALPTSTAKVERVFAVQVLAFDWNCPQHITPRYTQAELAPLHAELTRLRVENAELRGADAARG